MKQHRFLGSNALCALAAFLLTACGGGGNNGGDNDNGNPGPDTSPTPALSFSGIKTFRFTWSDASDATHYRLLENPDGLSGFTPVSGDIPQGTQVYEHRVPLYARTNAQYLLQSCNATGCTDSASVAVSGSLANSIGYFKAGSMDAGDRFGGKVALSTDGNTLAVGAYGEDENDNSVLNSGAVYVFTRDADGGWSQQAYLTASNAGAFDSFGFSIALSADGGTLAVGAYNEDSNATGVNDSNQGNNIATNDAGAVYVFTRGNDATWEQQAYIKASNTDEGDFFGYALAMSGDGNTLAVGAYNEDSGATGSNGDGGDNSSFNSGAVYIFIRDNGGEWSHSTYLKTNDVFANRQFGYSVSLDQDGNTLAVGTIASGAYVFTRDESDAWSQQINLDMGVADKFGKSVALSADGDTLAVGAHQEDSGATGMSGDEANDSGAAYIFSRDGGGNWSQQAYFKASNAETDDWFGYSITLDSSGNTLAVSAFREAGAAIGLNGDQSNNSASRSGAVYVFTRNSGGEWSQQAYVKASNTDADDGFGYSLSLSGDGGTLAVGALSEDSNA
ncbi:MAG TPA: integrin, partial [Gammaproteobacteria bacterium]|nr:integrin [Gammaproteobacteria bacterium]